MSERRNNFGKGSFGVDFNAFESALEKLEKAGGSIEKAVEDGMREAFQQIVKDSDEALQPGNLPARGIYSQEETEKSLIREFSPKWSGSIIEVPVGFDKTMKGAGGWLITGTPKMQPAGKLSVIYGSKTYEKNVRKIIKQSIDKAVAEAMK